MQQALGIEKAERTQIESQLKAAELQIVALQSFRTPNAAVTRMNLPQDLPRAPTAEHLQQLTASQNEAKQLRILISESKLHETEIRAALAEEQTLRSKLDREKKNFSNVWLRSLQRPTPHPIDDWLF